MNVLVTGGAGFIGRRIVEALLARGTLDLGDGPRSVSRVRVADVGPPALPFPDDPRIETRYGDFAEPGAAAALVDADTALVFHLAAVVSGEAEEDFDLGMRVNVDGTRGLLEACRALGTAPRLVFASSVAAYGGDLPEVIEDTTPLTPQTSYGTQKAIGELLVHDFARKGFVDGRALRLPTIVVRPGKPNRAASSFASSIIREPLEGRRFACPVREDAGVWLLSPRRVVESFLHAAELPGEAFGAFRAVALPGMTVTVGEMVETLREVGGEEVAALVSFEPDPFIERIVYGWPVRFAPRRGEAMGFRADGTLREIVEAFVADDLAPKSGSAGERS